MHSGVKAQPRSSQPDRQTDGQEDRKADIWRLRGHMNAIVALRGFHCRRCRSGNALSHSTRQRARWKGELSNVHGVSHGSAPATAWSPGESELIRCSLTGALICWDSDAISRDGGFSPRLISCAKGLNSRYGIQFYIGCFAIAIPM